MVMMIEQVVKGTRGAGLSQTLGKMERELESFVAGARAGRMG